MPAEIYVAVTPFENHDGGALMSPWQVPQSLNDDGNLDIDENGNDASGSSTAGSWRPMECTRTTWRTCSRDECSFYERYLPAAPRRSRPSAPSARR